MVEAHAMRIHENGGPEVLTYETIEVGPPEAGKVLIKQEAIGLNFIDTYIRSGLYPAKLPTIPGFEGAGVVEEVGEDVAHLKPGDRVAYSSLNGTYATHVVGAADSVVKIPESVTFEEAAALMLKGMKVQGW